ncbi:MAG TPA: PPOX class F420-dependent oxidoreductase [Methylomirabilota bacterium]|jgi:PPOX class probable F420-dependent enzyme|nr:PPOX class F420-dependent oxidoreductase [Methylomirabilota bacterium]
MSLPKEEIERFLAERRNAVLGAIRKDGAPQLNPMWFHWTGDVFYISTTRTRFKYNHLKRDPRVTLCIDDVTGFRTVIVEGRAEIIEDDIWGPTRAIVEKYVDKDHVEARMARLRTEPRVLLKIHPDKWISWDLSLRAGPARVE